MELRGCGSRLHSVTVGSFHQVAVGWFTPPRPPLPPHLPPLPSPSPPPPHIHSARLGPCQVSAVTASPSLITSQPRCWADQRQLLPRHPPPQSGWDRHVTDVEPGWAGLGGAFSIHHWVPRRRKAAGRRSLGMVDAGCRGLTQKTEP